MRVRRDRGSTVAKKAGHHRYLFYILREGRLGMSMAEC
jgi:hypothetical protein